MESDPEAAGAAAPPVQALSQLMASGLQPPQPAEEPAGLQPLPLSVFLTDYDLDVIEKEEARSAASVFVDVKGAPENQEPKAADGVVSAAAVKAEAPARSIDKGKGTLVECVKAMAGNAEKGKGKGKGKGKAVGVKKQQESEKKHDLYVVQPPVCLFNRQSWVDFPVDFQSSSVDAESWQVDRQVDFEEMRERISKARKAIENGLTAAAPARELTGSEKELLLQEIDAASSNREITFPRGMKRVHDASEDAVRLQTVVMDGAQFCTGDLVLPPFLFTKSGLPVFRIEKRDEEAAVVSNISVVGVGSTVQMPLPCSPTDCGSDSVNCGGQAPWGLPAGDLNCNLGADMYRSYGPSPYSAENVEDPTSYYRKMCEALVADTDDEENLDLEEIQNKLGHVIADLGRDIIVPQAVNPGHVIADLGCDIMVPQAVNQGLGDVAPVVEDPEHELANAEIPTAVANAALASEDEEDDDFLMDFDAEELDMLDLAAILEEPRTPIAEVGTHDPDLADVEAHDALAQAARTAPSVAMGGHGPHAMDLEPGKQAADAHAPAANVPAADLNEFVFTREELIELFKNAGSSAGLPGAFQ